MVAAAATASSMGATTRIPRVSQSENFTTTDTSGQSLARTNPAMIPGLFQIPQELASFSGLTAYFSADNSNSTMRNDSGYQWPSSAKSNYWPTSSDFYYQNYMTNNAGYTATISNGFYSSSQMDQSNLVPVRNRLEYPALFAASDLASTAASTYTPTPAQLLLSSSELFQSPPSIQPTNAMIKSTVLFDTSDQSATDTFSTTINDYTQSMQMITGDNCTNTSGYTGFNLISEVTNTLLG